MSMDGVAGLHELDPTGHQVHAVLCVEACHSCRANHQSSNNPQCLILLRYLTPGCVAISILVFSLAMPVG